MSNVQALLNLIKGDLEVDLIPVGIGALQILEKTPGVLGIEAAEAYVLGNAPAALLAGATSLLQQEIAALNAKLQAMQAAQANPTTAQAAAKPK
jgi:hypothetical protein